MGMLRPGGRPCRPGGRPRAPGGRPGRPGGPPDTRLAILAACPACACAWSCISLAMSGLWPAAAPPPPPEDPIEEFRSAIVTCKHSQLAAAGQHNSLVSTHLLGPLNRGGHLLLVLLGEERQDLTYDGTHPLHYLRLKIIFLSFLLNL